jgi:hypothetical protein
MAEFSLGVERGCAWPKKGAPAQPKGTGGSKWVSKAVKASPAQLV